jgi:hypothetical protein
MFSLKPTEIKYLRWTRFSLLTFKFNLEWSLQKWTAWLQTWIYPVFEGWFKTMESPRTFDFPVLFFTFHRAWGCYFRAEIFYSGVRLFEVEFFRLMTWSVIVENVVIFFSRVQLSLLNQHSRSHVFLFISLGSIHSTCNTG